MGAAGVVAGVDDVVEAVLWDEPGPAAAEGDDGACEPPHALNPVLVNTKSRSAIATCRESAERLLGLPRLAGDVLFIDGD